MTEDAKASPRLRMNMDLRNGPNDQSQRMLNAIEPGSILPIHRHLSSSETVVMVRGKIRWLFFNEEGKEFNSIVLDANTNLRMLSVEKGQWHTLECLESGSVVYSSKDGAYHPLGEDEIWKGKKHS